MQNDYRKFPISEFDLEKELMQDPKKATKLQNEIDGQIQTIKTDLQKGATTKDYQELGKILQALLASKKVITYIIRG